MNLGIKLRENRHCPRIDTIELKHHIGRRLGHQKAEKYFSFLNKYISLQLNKLEFDKLCIGLLGRENISLHNGLIRALIKNACIAKSPPPKYKKWQQSSLDVKVKNGLIPRSPKKGRTPTHRKPRNFSGEKSVSKKIQEKQSAVDILSLNSKPPIDVNSVEDGEEVEQFGGSPSIHSRSPLRAPFGVSLHAKRPKKLLLQHGSSPSFDLDTCQINGEIPDSVSLRKRLEERLVMENLNVSTYCVNLLNNGLDVFMKRLLKPCLDLAASRSVHNYQTTLNNGMSVVSMMDFRVAMELNLCMLGEDWPVHLEKVSMCVSQDYMDG